MSGWRLMRNVAFVAFVATVGLAEQSTVRADPYEYCAYIGGIPGCQVWLDQCSEDLNNDGDVCGYLCSQIYGASGSGGWYDSDSYSCFCSGGNC